MAEEGDARSFWDVGEPRRVLRRIDDGHRSCSDLMCMIQERADVELRYAKSLRQWAAKWDELLTKGPEYGTVLTAWRTVLQEASAVAKVHEDCRMRLTGDEGPYCQIYKWMGDYFHKSAMGGLRETDEAREDFATAQRDYAKLLAKVNRAKKAYYAASIAAYRSRRYADDEASSPAVSPDAKWKLRERADRLALERERLKQVYLRRVMVCNSTAKDRYVEKMTSIFNRWQEFERKRLEHLQIQLQLFVSNLTTHSGTGMGQVYRRVLEQLRRAEPATDIEEWGQRYGTGCHASWPQYEEIDPRTHPPDGGVSSEDIHHRDPMAQTATDEMTDEFTTDSYDSDPDVAHHHAQYGCGYDHLQSAYRPYRSHQHEMQHFATKYPYQQEQRWRHVCHEQRPPGASYSQNQDMSEKWLNELSGGHGRMKESGSSGRRRHIGGAVQTCAHHPHHNDTAHHHKRHHADSNHLHKGQRSSVHEHHHRRESSPRLQEKDMRRSSSHQRSQDQRIKDSFATLVSTSPSQDSYIHDDGTVTTEAVYDADYGYHGNVKSDASSSEGQTGSSPQEETFQTEHIKDQTSEAHRRKSSIHTGSHTQALAQTPSGQVQAPQQSLTRAVSSLTRAVSSHHTPTTATQVADRPVEMQTGPKGPVQTGQELGQTFQQQQQQQQGQATPNTVAQTYIQRRNDAEEKAMLLKKARKVLKPQEGERIVRALYDFKPSTRDEMSFKQGEFVVQIGDHLSNGWAYGRKVGAKGHFPASYVQ